MELIRGLHNLRPRHRGCVATLGAFDGIHRGHREVLEQLIAKGKALSLPTVVILFEPLPREYFAPVQAPARLTSFRERFTALREIGVDRVLRIRFCEQLQKMSASDFIQQVIVEGLGVHYLVAGDDTRFGHNREGDLNALKAAGEQHGFEAVDTKTLHVSDDRVSSTRIREALEQAEFEQAEQLLGRPYSISGRVIMGKQLGRQLGVPTANIQLHRIRAPLSGVYAVEVIGAGEKQYGVANVGTRPTIDDGLQANLEVHLLNFDSDIYGQQLAVIFRKKIREEKKFSSLDELKSAIEDDIAFGRHFFAIK
jgi:riboflavin kinase/FMN adenylyltransferase